MEFYNNGLFHIYNQGNNKQQIFFDDDNYEFFIWKMRAYLLPFGNLVSYCLMPNHFHWLFDVHKKTIPRKEFWAYRDKAELERRIFFYRDLAQPVKAKRKNISNDISLQEAIGFLLQSYTKAINKQYDRSGSLFRMRSKAKDGWIDEFVPRSNPSEKRPSRPFGSKTNYAYTCLCYIHANPVNAGLVSKPEDWIYSSAKDYAGLRKGTLCNLETGFGLMSRPQY